MANDEYFKTRMSFNKSRDRLWKVICGYLRRFIPKSSRVLELGAGHCHFINNVAAKKRYALDISRVMLKHRSKGVEAIVSSCAKIKLPASSIDIVFASNLFEHLDDHEIKDTLDATKRVLAKGGKLIVMQPNFKYAYKEYFDDYTHKKIFTHISMVDMLKANGFRIVNIVPKFLPFSVKSRLPPSPTLMWLYLRLPLRPFAGQMLVVASKS